MVKRVHTKERREQVGRRQEDVIVAKLRRLHGKNARRIDSSSLLLEGMKTVNDFTLLKLIDEGKAKVVMSFVDKVSRGREPCTVPVFYTTALEFFLKERKYEFVADVCQSAAIAKVKHRAPYIMAIKSLLSPSFVDGEGKQFVDYQEVELVSNILGYISDHNRAARKPSRIGIPDIYEAAIYSLSQQQIHSEPEWEGKLDYLAEFYTHALDAQVSAERCTTMLTRVLGIMMEDKELEKERKAKLIFEITEHTIKSHLPYTPLIDVAKSYIKKNGLDAQVRRLERLQHCHMKPNPFSNRNNGKAKSV